MINHFLTLFKSNVLLRKMDQMNEEQILNLQKELSEQLKTTNEYLKKVRYEKAQKIIKEKDLKSLWTVILTLNPKTIMPSISYIGLWFSKEKAENHMNNMIKRSSKFIDLLHVEDVAIPDDWNGEETEMGWPAIDLRRYV